MTNLTFTGEFTYSEKEKYNISPILSNSNLKSMWFYLINQDKILYNEQITITLKDPELNNEAFIMSFVQWLGLSTMTYNVGFMDKDDNLLYRFKVN